MPARRLKEFLDSQGVKYTTVNHSPAFTAPEIAASAHIPGREMAKTVMVKLDGELSMAVLPANTEIDLEQLRALTGAKEVELATEDDFCNAFPECDIGSMPPFGNLYGMPVFEDESLTEDSMIAFNAGSHRELVRLAYRDYEDLVQPRIGAFARKF